ncbi:MAG TPA: HAD family hydrolase [Candidatus Cloacimonadota bacterium]|nr:HAD family hydrolase [Candidatus Cloacimonadota bacterium]HQL15575.1 HAD family hydrolase [Candidatus Cloacimonadota bacterium]
MKLKGFIFDLDGTLLNTLEDVAAAENKTLAEFGLPTRPAEEFRFLVGGGAEDIARRLLPPEMHSPENIMNFIYKFRANYHLNWHDKTRLYPGLTDLINHLLDENFPLAVLSNKPEEFTQKLVDFFFGNWLGYEDRKVFSPVIGQRKDQPVKPDPTLALDIASQWKLPAESIGLIGDSDIDVFTAKNAGMFAIGAGWGFRGKAELAAAGARIILDRPFDLLRYLD